MHCFASVNMCICKVCVLNESRFKVFCIHKTTQTVSNAVTLNGAAKQAAMREARMKKKMAMLEVIFLQRIWGLRG